MMDWEDLGDWLMWALLASAVLSMAATALVALVVLVHHAVRYVRRGKAPPPPSIEELLASGPEEGERCAICVTPYEAGEACSVLPGCAHMFHKPCLAKWLRKKNTCPLCRATVGGGARVPAAENMV